MPSTIFYPAFGIADHEVRMFLQKYWRRAAMVIDQIQNHPHAEFMGTGYEFFQIFIGAVFGIYIIIVFQTVRIHGVVQCTFFLTVAPELQPYIVICDHRRAKIKDIRSQFRQVRQHPEGALQCSSRCEWTQEYLVYD